ncbi:DUF6906 family protein [Clostridium botulinum]|uniref:DUF6906 family protein n=1 Tax=Clostridium botulinum TaxID=1491 RepID=UPI003D6E18FF
MKHLKRLTLTQKKILSSLGLNANNYLRFTQHWESFTLVDIRTMKVLPPVRY